MQKMFTVRIEDQNPVHTRITVFNRGGNAGTLTINTSDVDEFITRLTSGISVSQQVDVVTGAMVGVVIGKL